MARLPVGDRALSNLPVARRASATIGLPTNLAADLETLYEGLCEIGAKRLAESDVRPVRRALEVFGFHLAQLDIRQNSVFHAKALSQLMVAAGIDGSQWEEWSETERLRFLEKELQSPRPFLHATASAGPEADAVLGCYRKVARHIERCGSDGVGSLIISMTRRLSDLLVVYVLAREAGLTKQLPQGQVCVLPVVPLFETLGDLEAAPSILGAFLEEPVTRRSLEFLASNGSARSRCRSRSRSWWVTAIAIRIRAFWPASGACKKRSPSSRNSASMPACASAFSMAAAARSAAEPWTDASRFLSG